MAVREDLNPDVLLVRRSRTVFRQRRASLSRANGFAAARVRYGARRSSRSEDSRRSLRVARRVRISILVIDSVAIGRFTTFPRRSAFIIRLRTVAKDRSGTSIFRCDRGLEY